MSFFGLRGYSKETALRNLACKAVSGFYRLAPQAAPPARGLACGVIGAGSFFRYAYAPALNRPPCPLVVSGLFSRNRDNLQASQRRLRYKTAAFDTLESLLDSGIEAVLITAPNSFHFDYCSAALQRNLHVMCEKPLTNGVAEVLRLEQELADAPRILMVDFNERYLDRIRMLKHLLAEGFLGDLISVAAFHNQNLASDPRNYRFFEPATAGGGVIHTAGIHLINLFLDWFGSPKRVEARIANRQLPSTLGEDTASCAFHFDNGMKATLEASLANQVASSYEHVVISGSKGTVVSDMRRSDIVCTFNSGRRESLACRREIVGDSIFSALAAFASCIRTGAAPLTGVEDSIRTLKVVEALYLAAQRGRMVDMEEIDDKYRF